METKADPPTSPAPTATWAWQPPGPVQMPVLLYHHVSEAQGSRYAVSLNNFEAQIAHLKRAGYTGIPISRLVDALSSGAQLPAKPVVVTFDDGYRDVYEHAYPVMQRNNFVGTVYIITDQLGTRNYMNMEMLRSLADSGWEIGSHTQSHANLRQPGVKLVSEIEESRRLLEEHLHTPVVTFSYPYGLTSQYIRRLVEQAGYHAAVGLGSSRKHSPKLMYYISRIEIPGDADLVEFAQLVAGGSAGSLPPPMDFPSGP
ncbi:MAG: polysaccharide deacetylase family protein [Anaerolineales bacterium]